MKLIFTLGNPENRYENTRHNVGFWAADDLAARRGAKFTEKSKFKCLLTETGAGDEKLLIAKPTTYYNLVGDSLQALMKFYSLDPQDVLVIHDDLALPFGTIRTRIGGSGGGNNGIKSINQQGGEDTLRLRIGIGNDLRERIDDADFVLSKFSAAETKKLADLQPKIAALVDDFLADTLATTTHQAA